MIRDPSDGSVRRRRETPETKDLCDEKPVLGADVSGLPMVSGKAEYLARLDKSRDWLKTYHK